MITGAHIIVYSKDAEGDRNFIRDVLGFAHVDAGHGWLIFALPPSEVAVHPGDLVVADDDGVVEVVLREDVGSDAAASLATEAERLTRWLDGVRISSVYTSLQMKSARLP